MLIPEFTLQNIIPDYPDASSAFQAFVPDLLAIDFPGLDCFPAIGKDGCIDFCHTVNNQRMVGECKFIGDGDIKTAYKEWKDVYIKLQKHLTSPNGPTTGQSQYSPWYRTDLPISEYLFCISCELKNQAQVDSMEKTIRTDFHTLATQHAHLDHIKNIKVKVLHWGRLAEKMKERPTLFFKWFKNARIPGLEPLELPSRSKGFRAYLNDDKLEYYSRSKHLETHPVPAGSDIVDEERLFAALDTGKEIGLVITGSGGLGKSRLALHLARMCEKKDWLVFRVRRIRSDIVERLAKVIGDSQTTLLLFDYIETQKEFSQVVEDIIEFNYEWRCKLRFIASCRTSYYKAVVKGRIPHKALNLSDEGEWSITYRQHAVRHILQRAGLPIDERHIRVCHDIPVFAVFMAFLMDTGRTNDLDNLIGTADFAEWVTKRVDASFPGTEKELATLVGLFPIPEEFVGRLDNQRFGKLFEILAEDEWIEEHPWDETSDTPIWATIHDVLADGIIINHLNKISKTVEVFLDNFISTAVDCSCLRPALITLQRLANEKPLAEINWFDLFTRHIATSPSAWREVRDILIRLSSLSPMQRLQMLNGPAAVWDGAECDIKIQNGLGWIARWAAEGGLNELTAEQADNLKGWLIKAANNISWSNFVLTSGLRLFPADISPFAQKWINSNPALFQTHYLIVAWLETGLLPDAVSYAINKWCAVHGEKTHFTFIIRAWLNNGGEKENIEPAIKAWLAVPENRVSKEASFVYQSWLDATKDSGIVEEGIKTWLDVPENRVSKEAQFVYKSWLDAGGQKDVIQKAVSEWLAVPENRVSKEASFVYKSWLVATKDSGIVEEGIKAWLDVPENRVSKEAQFVYHSWLDATKDSGIVEEGIKAWLDVPENRVSKEEASFVYKSWLDATKDSGIVEEGIKAWLDVPENRVSKEEASFVYKSWLDAGGQKDVIQKAVSEWLTVPENRVSKDAHFVYKSWLDATTECSFVEAAIKDWLAFGKNSESFEANYILKSWLDADGQKDVIQKAIPEWLSLFSEHAEADYIYRAWLEAGGESDLVMEPTIKWLNVNKDKPEASFVTKFLCRQKKLPIEAVKDILYWCRTFPDNDDSIWRLTQLGQNLLTDVAVDLYQTCEDVISHLMTKDRIGDTTHGQIIVAISYLITSSQRDTSIRQRTNELLVKWLQYPKSFGKISTYQRVQNKGYILRVSELLKTGMLNINRDRDALTRFLIWVNNWQPERKKEVAETLRYLSRTYSAAELWGIVGY